MTQDFVEIAPELQKLSPEDRAELAYLFWQTIPNIRVELFEFYDQDLFDEIEGCVKDAHGMNQTGLSTHGELVRDRVLNMDPETRAEVTHLLWQSVPGMDDVLGHNDPEFIAEINRRLNDFESGREKGIPAEEFMERLRKKYG